MITKEGRLHLTNSALSSSSMPERDWGAARPGSLFPTPVPPLPAEKHVGPDSRRASVPCAGPLIVPCGDRETQTAPCQPPLQRSLAELAIEFKALIVICF